jgi:hypothetical protein
LEVKGARLTSIGQGDRWKLRLNFQWLRLP